MGGFDKLISSFFFFKIPDNMAGRGGYADVYRGVLEGGEAIAVKRLSKTSNDERKEKEFLNEIGTLGHVSHPNVTSLLGCCLDNGLYLVFQFSSKGSVSSLLHGTTIGLNRNLMEIVCGFWVEILILIFFFLVFWVKSCINMCSQGLNKWI